MEHSERLPYLDDIRLAPPEFTWPDGLPEPFQYQLEDGASGTAFPVPADTALQLYGLWCDYIPGECQRRIDAAYEYAAAIEEELQGELGFAPPDIIEGWQTWEVVIVVTGAVVLALGTGVAAGYFAGAMHD